MKIIAISVCLTFVPPLFHCTVPDPFNYPNESCANRFQNFHFRFSFPYLLFGLLNVCQSDLANTVAHSKFTRFRSHGTSDQNGFHGIDAQPAALTNWARRFCELEFAFVRTPKKAMSTCRVLPESLPPTRYFMFIDLSFPVALCFGADGGKRGRNLPTDSE